MQIQSGKLSRFSGVMRGMFIYFIVLGILGIGITGCNKNPVGPGNNPPIITSISASKTVVNFKESISVHAVFSDVDGDTLTSTWTLSGGVFATIKRDSVTWQAPDTSGRFVIRLTVRDKKGLTARDSVVITSSNQLPVIQDLKISSPVVFIGQVVTVRSTAADPDGKPLIYSWRTSAGQFIGSTSLDTIQWSAPQSPQTVEITLTVRDQSGGEATKSISINISGELGVLWVADTYDNEIIKVSVTGTILFRFSGYNHPRCIAINPESREVWIADTDNNRIVRLGPDGSILSVLIGLKAPQSIGVYSFDGTAWVIQDSDSNQVLKVLGNGTTVRKRINGLLHPRAISVDQINGDVWIADTGNNRIIRLKQDIPDTSNVETASLQYVRFFTGFNRPSALDVNSLQHLCWVADKFNNRIVQIDQNGSEKEISGFQTPVDVAVNKRDGSVWVADTGLEKVIKIKREIPIPPAYNIQRDRGFHFEIAGYRQPASVTVNDISENSQEWTIWFAEESRLVKVSNEGNVITTVTGFNAPQSLKVNLR